MGSRPCHHQPNVRQLEQKPKIEPVLKEFAVWVKSVQLIDPVSQDAGRWDVARVEEVVDVMVWYHKGIKPGEEPVEARWLF